MLTGQIVPAREADVAEALDLPAGSLGDRARSNTHKNLLDAYSKLDKEIDRLLRKHRLDPDEDPGMDALNEFLDDKDSDFVRWRSKVRELAQAARDGRGDEVLAYFREIDVAEAHYLAVQAIVNLSVEEESSGRKLVLQGASVFPEDDAKHVKQVRVELRALLDNFKTDPSEVEREMGNQESAWERIIACQAISELAVLGWDEE